MYNGIGLQTARGSGTNGYVVKNMSAFRPRDGPPNGGAFGTGANAFGGADDFARTSRGPDQGILEHERKRAVEVKCAELEDALEEKGVPEDEIFNQVSALRTRLLAQLPQARDVKSLKPSDTHALAEAKTVQLARFSGAFGISQGYREGAAFDRDEQERIRAAKRAEYEEKDRLRLERAREAEREEEVRREAIKVARREDERRRIASERAAARDGPAASSRRRSPSPLNDGRRARSFTPVTQRGRSLSRSRSPVVRRQRSISSSRSRSRSPPPRRSGAADAGRRAPSFTPVTQRGRSRSRSPVGRRPRSISSSRSRSRSPVDSYRRRRLSSTPPPARRRRDSDTPPRH